LNFYIYKYIINNNIYYIGQTTDLTRRIKEHKREQKFLDYNNFKIFYFQCRNQKETDSYEYFLINKYHPILNVAFKYEDFIIDIKEPEWFLYEEDNFLPFKEKIKLKKEHHYKEGKISDINNINKIELIEDTSFFSSFNNISLFDQKIILFMLLKYKINNLKFTDKNIIFPMPEFLKYYHYTHSGNIYQEVKERSSFVKKEDEYIFNFPKDIKNTPLFKLSEEEINSFSQITCKYTIPCFENIILNKKIKKEDFVKFLCPNAISYQNNFKDFRRKVLDSVFRDLKNIGYDYTFKTIYTGRKITDLIFCLKEENI